MGNPLRIINYMETASDSGSPWDAKDTGKILRGTIIYYHCSYACTEASAVDCCQRQETAAGWTCASSKIKETKYLNNSIIIQS